MARVPANTPDAPHGVPDLLITAAEWDAILTEDPQASPDWKVAWPYGSWQRRLPGSGGRARLRLAADGDAEDTGGVGEAGGGSRWQESGHGMRRTER